jgi:hypothetical protein
MKFRPPVKHTPPSMSKRGEPLQGSLQAIAGLKLEWRLRSSDGLVHFMGGWEVDITNPKDMRAKQPWTECNAEPPFEDTLADVSCLWCMAGKER